MPLSCHFFSTDAGCAHPRIRLKPQAAALGTGSLPAMCCQLSQKPASVLSKPLPLLGSHKGKFRCSFSPYLPNPNPGLITESSCWVQHISSNLKNSLFQYKNPLAPPSGPVERHKKVEGPLDITCIPSKWDGTICNHGRVLGKGSIQNLLQAAFEGFGSWTEFVSLLIPPGNRNYDNYLCFFSPPSTFCPDGSISNRGILTTRNSISCHDKHFQWAFQIIFYAESCLLLFATEKAQEASSCPSQRLPKPYQSQHPCFAWDGTTPLGLSGTTTALCLPWPSQGTSHFTPSS